MDSIKENGYVRWKGFLLTIGSALSVGGVVLMTMFLYMDNKISNLVSKAQYDESNKHIMISLTDIKNELNRYRGGSPRR